jgi:hypothetical protein
MTHSGSLKDKNVSDDVRDVRGTTVRGSDGRTLGKVDDVIFDHDTMSIPHAGAGELKDREPRDQRSSDKRGAALSRADDGCFFESHTQWRQSHHCGLAEALSLVVTAGWLF